MNIKAVFNTLGKISLVESVLLLLPFAVSLYYSEPSSVFAFAVTIALAAAVGGLLLLAVELARELSASDDTGELLPLELSLPLTDFTMAVTANTITATASINTKAHTVRNILLFFSAACLLLLIVFLLFVKL